MCKGADKCDTSFTEKDREMLEKLPEGEKQSFVSRFAEIAIRKRIADDTWSEAMDRISDDADVLVKEIKERLAANLVG